MNISLFTTDAGWMYTLLFFFIIYSKRKVAAGRQAGSTPMTHSLGLILKKRCVETANEAGANSDKPRDLNSLGYYLGVETKNTAGIFVMSEEISGFAALRRRPPFSLF